MAWATVKTSATPSEFKVLTAEVFHEPSYPTSSALDTSTSIYFQGSNTVRDLDAQMNTIMDSNTLQGCSNEANTDDTPRKQGKDLNQLKPFDLLNKKEFNNNAKRRITIKTPKQPLTPMPTKDSSMGSMESPKSSRATDILKRYSASPGPKLSRLRKRREAVEVQSEGLLSSPSPSSPPLPFPSSIPEAVEVTDLNGGEPAAQSQHGGSCPTKKVRLKENFSCEEFVDQLLDRKTVDWYCVMDPATRKFFIEFSQA